MSDFYWPENWKGELTLKENTDEIDLDEDDGEDDEISNVCFLYYCSIWQLHHTGLLCQRDGYTSWLSMSN